MAAPRAPLDALTGLEAARFGVYVHFPYCGSKCPYCDFASIAAKVIPEVRYTKAILCELEQRVREGVGRRTVDSIFIGGGTPSLWSPALVSQVLEAVASTLSLAEGLEVTLEANPGSADAARFADYRAAGVNRLSMGVQSFEPTTLKALGRAHDGAEAIAAFKKARAAKFENVSMDFIYGVMGQTEAQVEADAKTATSLEPEHLSAYALTLDRPSLAEEVPLAKQLSRGEVSLPADEKVVAMQRRVRDVYGAAGLERYEVSNYARPGYHSRHNSLYWTGGEYLALGTGATGFLTRPQRVRYSNHRSAERYLAEVEAGRVPAQTVEPLTEDELFSERVAMGLRLTSGVNLEAVCAAHQQAYEPRRAIIGALVSSGLALLKGERVALTDEGMDLHSAIAASVM